MKTSTPEKQSSNGHAETNGHAVSPVQKLDASLTRIERMIKNPNARPGSDAHSKLQSVMNAVDDAETLFFSEPRAAFGVDFFRLRTRLEFVTAFATTINGGHTSEAADSSGKFSRLSDDPDIDHLEQIDMLRSDEA